MTIKGGSVGGLGDALVDCERGIYVHKFHYHDLCDSYGSDESINKDS